MYRKCRLNSKLSAFYGLHFPYKTVQKSSHRYEVTVGLGGNVGDVKRRFERVFYFFQKDKRVEVLQTSLILKNPPFGYVEQDDFLNSIIVLKTSMTPFMFLDYLLRVEKKFQRKRSFANAPRTLDLDIIFFDNKIINTKKLIVPHVSWYERESVVIPLAGIR